MKQCVSRAVPRTVKCKCTETPSSADYPSSIICQPTYAVSVIKFTTLKTKFCYCKHMTRIEFYFTIGDYRKDSFKVDHYTSEGRTESKMNIREFLSLIEKRINEENARLISISPITGAFVYVLSIE